MANKNVPVVAMPVNTKAETENKEIIQLISRRMVPSDILY